MKTGIIGGAGYTAGELLRLLVNHPHVDIAFVHSNSQAGKPVHHVHQDLAGDIALAFTNQLFLDEVDLIFLCMGHGQSQLFLEKNAPLPPQLKVIDLSHDFRLKRPDHSFVYGLPELNKSSIQGSQYIANPGCFATAIQLALLPLAAQQVLNNEVHVHAITGSTGAGQAPSATTHFSWRNNNVSVYKAFTHQHLGEIGQSIQQLQTGFERAINFIPVRGNFSRGIMASVYTECAWTAKEATQYYQDYYQAHPFVLVSDANPDLKQVVNTNKALLYVEKHDNKLLIISMIDNLLKGASGQAVQNMNLIFGWDETTALKLKSIGF
ncbi:N-acetyl-gamma-glutamyl-phosphate reductase [uncultured Microscilla sp.]|uniref:N-acetyl-gamma-glutamyl-phosphate reductase n=1 Tax=uncultured Microscilla sp. TaxID=432653 RepID=UPI00260E7757|nr:N-acetyl-gamma-glutamyl-phosphate reductase [uncultured Microscilla sp.]